MVRQVLTEDQLKQLDRKAERAAQRVLRRYRRSAMLGFAILLLGGVTERLISADDAHDARQSIVTSGNAIAVAGCNRDFRTAVGVQSILRNALANQERRFREGQVSKREIEVIRKISREQLKAYPLPDCRPAASSVTQDVDNGGMTKVPHPFYPGDPRAPKPPKFGG